VAVLEKIGKEIKVKEIQPPAQRENSPGSFKTVLDARVRDQGYHGWRWGQPTRRREE